MLCTTDINTCGMMRTQTGAAERHSSGLDTNSCYYIRTGRTTEMIEYGREKECNMITELKPRQHGALQILYCIVFHIPTAPVACTHWLNHGYTLCRVMLFRHNQAVGK